MLFRSHIPLIVNGQGVRLSKRDASLSMASLRVAYTSEEIIGHIAYITGLRPSSRPVSAADLALPSPVNSASVRLDVAT